MLSPDPVLYIDDRWLYELEEDYSEIELLDLNQVKPKKLMFGEDITIVGLGYSTSLAVEGAKNLENEINRSADVFDLRIINPLNCEDIISSVKKTGRLLVIDGDWKTAGMAGEIISRVTEEVDISLLKTNPKRICLPDAPAPTSKVLEEIYYPDINLVNEVLFNFFEK